MASVTHHRFSVDEYEQMIDKGILTENERVELIRGEIVEKMVIGPLHSATVKRINRLLTTRLLASAIVSVQDPVVLSDSEPEPDLALLLPNNDFYATSKPTANDVRLIIEVSDSSLAYDREIKLPLYAQAGIQDFWIVNLIESKVEVYRQPLASGSYTSRSDFTRGDELSPLAYADSTFLVDEILG
jgi:Uma2 family endonuclease